MEQNISDRAGAILGAWWTGLLARVRGIVEKDGVLAIPAMVSVPIKVWYFYVLMGVSANFFAVWLVTCLLLLLLFTSTRHKWIPTVIYLVISVLMFADVAYSSFFNRYLSVNMLGAAGFLGDVGDSIREVLRPKFFLLFLDVLLLFASLIERTARRRRGKASGMTAVDSENRERENADERDV